LAIISLRENLKHHGLVVRVRRCTQPFNDEQDDTGHEHAIDVVFVDDLCVVIFARNAKALRTAIETLVVVLRRIFGPLGLIINWAPGKSELMVIYRGKGASEQYAAMQTPGGYGVSLPGLDHVLTAVSSYKHLGSSTQSNGSNMQFVMKRSSLALSAYVPIASKVFGARNIDRHLKLSLYNSLVESRLLFNCHVRIFKSRELLKLSAVYMRVVRRMSGQMRFDASSISDIEVRKAFNVPSIDCIVIRKKLQYWSRLAGSDSYALLSLLALDYDELGPFCDSIGMAVTDSLKKGRRGKVSPWMRSIKSDCEVFYKACPAVREALPPPDNMHEMHCWWTFAQTRKEEWTELVSQLHFFESVLDRHKSTELCDDLVKTYPCTICGSISFATEKALMSHVRAKHRIQCDARRYAPADSACMCCGTTFSMRPRLIAHLTDRRRTKCIDFIVQHYSPMDEKFVAELDEADRRLRAQARKSGLTQPKSCSQAVAKDGRRLGRICI
jgi:hypothetical protein